MSPLDDILGGVFNYKATETTVVTEKWLKFSNGSRFRVSAIDGLKKVEKGTEVQLRSGEKFIVGMEPDDLWSKIN